MLALTLLVRDEMDILPQWLDFHLPKCDLLVATDNGSIDGTREFLDARKSARFIVLHEDGSTWEQQAWVDRMIEIARERGAEWCCNSDVDEFWRGDLRAACEAARGNVIVVPSYHYVATLLDDAREPDPIKRLVRRERDPLFIWKKVIHQTAGFLTIAHGNHDAEFGVGVKKIVEDAKAISIAHFNEPSFEHFRRRYTRDGKVLTLKIIPDNRSWHVRRVYQAYEAGGVAALRDLWQDRLTGIEFAEWGKLRWRGPLVVDPVLGESSVNSLQSSETQSAIGNGPLAIVLSHYRLPLDRLRDFFDWNSELFRQFGVRVVVVSDAPREGLPDYARCLVYPPLERFALSRTSNAGIRAAIADGAAIVCKTDVDCVFSRRAILALRDVRPGVGRCLLYRKAESFERREAGRPWAASKGTLALHARDWERIRGYDERQDGYGVEDGDAYFRALAAGVAIERPTSAPVYHIRHSTEEPWNRSCGFNPDRHAANRETAHRAPWHDEPNSEQWGLRTED